MTEREAIFLVFAAVGAGFGIYQAYKRHRAEQDFDDLLAIYEYQRQVIGEVGEYTKVLRQYGVLTKEGAKRLLGDYISYTRRN